MRRIYCLLILCAGLALLGLFGCKFLWLSPGLIVGVDTDGRPYPEPRSSDSTGWFPPQDSANASGGRASGT